MLSFLFFLIAAPMAQGDVIPIVRCFSEGMADDGFSVRIEDDAASESRVAILDAIEHRRTREIQRILVIHSESNGVVHYLDRYTHGDVFELSIDTPDSTSPKGLLRTYNGGFNAETGEGKKSDKLLCYFAGRRH